MKIGPSQLPAMDLDIHTVTYIPSLRRKKTIENPWLGVVMALFSRAMSVRFREWYWYCMYVCHLDPGLPRLYMHRYLECIYARRWYVSTQGTFLQKNMLVSTVSMNISIQLQIYLSNKCIGNPSPFCKGWKCHPTPSASMRWQLEIPGTGMRC